MYVYSKLHSSIISVHCRGNPGKTGHSVNMGNRYMQSIVRAKYSAAAKRIFASS